MKRLACVVLLCCVSLLIAEQANTATIPAPPNTDQMLAHVLTQKITDFKQNGWSIDFVNSPIAPTSTVPCKTLDVTANAHDTELYVAVATKGPRIVHYFITVARGCVSDQAYVESRVSVRIPTTELAALRNSRQ